MSGFCGWVGEDAAPGGAEHALSGMAGRLPGYGDCRTRSAVRATAALRLNAGADAAFWHEEPGLLAAVDGRPRWSNPELASIAERSGHAAALAQAWRRHGTALFRHLHGAFAVAVVETATRSGILAIDRIGIRTLCYSEPVPGLLVFGSTTDSVAAHPRVGATVAPQSLYNFLYFVDRIPAPYTVYDEQRKLVPGEFIEIRDGAARRGRYWHMPYATAPGADAGELGRELMDRLSAAVAGSVDCGRFPQTGAFLSGGLDSSTVVGLLSHQGGGRARTFTISFDHEGFDESEYARIAADHFGTDHRVHSLRPEDVLDAIPKIAQAYDEPFGNHSAVPTYHCARIAREAGVDVLLAGDGGDEIFAGNARYLSDRIFDRYRRLPAFVRRGLIEPALNTLPGGLPVVRKGRNYVRIASMSPVQRMYRNNIYARGGTRAVFAEDAAAVIDSDLPLRHVEALFADPEDADEIQRLMHVDLRITLADGDLRKVNRMCEVAGVDVRYPFLDDDVVEFAAGLPGALLTEGDRLRHFFKEAARGFLPEPILTKKKHGFGLPFQAFSDRHAPLLEIACDSASSLKKRGYFRGDYIDRLIAAHRGADNGLHRDDIWDLMMIELWFQRHYDTRP